MSFGAAVSSLAYATLHPLQATKAVYAALVAPVHTGSVRHCVDLLSCVSVNGLQLLTVCPKLVSLLGTPQMEQLAVQTMTLLQAGHQLLQSDEVRTIAEQVSTSSNKRTQARTQHTQARCRDSQRHSSCRSLCRMLRCQTLSLLSTPACRALLQQLSCFVVAALRLIQSNECSAANDQIAHALQSILHQLTPTTQPTHTTTPTQPPTQPACPAPASQPAEYGDWTDALLCCHRAHRMGRLSGEHWMCVRSLLGVRDGRVMALWQRWKGRLVWCEQRSVRGESERYRLAGEDEEGVDGMVEEEAADVNLDRFMAELQALLTDIAEEQENECT